MLTSFNVIIFLKISPMISNFKLFQCFNISQNFVQNVQKQKKKPSVLIWSFYSYQINDSHYDITFHGRKQLIN